MKATRRRALAIVTAAVSILALAGPVARASTSKTYRLTVHDPAHDVETDTSAPRPYSPTDDLRTVTLTDDAKRVTVTFTTARFAAYVGPSATFHYLVTIDDSVGGDRGTHSYRLAVDLAGSQAELPNATPVAHHKSLWEQTSVVVFTNDQPAQRSCGGLHLVPTKHAWVETVPDSCLPHLRTPVTVAGSREREIDEGPGQPAHDYEDDFQS